MELLVVPPTHFDVLQSYNTRMRPDHPHGRPDKRRTFEQWARMVSVLKYDLGIEIGFMNPDPSLPDMAFACDPGLWINDVFIASNFWAKQRASETQHFIDWFSRDENTLTIKLPPDSFFEGGDCVVVGNKVLIGYGENRTDASGVDDVEGALMEEDSSISVVPIRRVTEEFYHLNSVMTYYPSAKLLAYYAPAFESDAAEKLRENLPGVKIVDLPEEILYRNHPDFGGEYLYSYCLNSIENNGKVLMSWCHPKHREILEDCGLQVIVCEDSEFERSGGAHRCETMIHNITKPL